MVTVYGDSGSRHILTRLFRRVVVRHAFTIDAPLNEYTIINYDTTLDIIL